MYVKSDGRRPNSTPANDIISIEPFWPDVGCWQARNDLNGWVSFALTNRVLTTSPSSK